MCSVWCDGGQGRRRNGHVLTAVKEDAAFFVDVLATCCDGNAATSHCLECFVAITRGGTHALSAGAARGLFVEKKKKKSHSSLTEPNI
ncbi:uncharacterized protein G2W53_011550 [Senna tora]|uniref:Uncharacterized protein n=1 Tax=Senna tora TaxID=362788 RepID=A0A834X1Z6_9FABA|nr:uncharacterized protein G2W53_011550 [Senna tora]